MSNADYSKRDLSVLWHPCTQMKDHEWLPVIPVCIACRLIVRPGRQRQGNRDDQRRGLFA